jgi:hypothetical protein
MIIGTDHETVGTLWKNGLFNETMLFDWQALPMIWVQVERSICTQGLRSSTVRAHSAALPPLPV